MLKKITNETHIEGLLYEHNLAVKVTGPNSKAPGTEFISGTVSVATDDACTNVVTVHFTYVTAVTSKGGANATFNMLKSIIDETTKSVMKHGKNEANYIRIDSAIGLNEFYSDRSGKEELVSAKRNEGGFVHPLNINDLKKEEERNTFKCDMIIHSVTLKEADEEKGLKEKAIVSGMIFDFRKSLLPVEFSVIDPAGIDYFVGLGASKSEPVFTQVWGNQISETIIKREEVASAWGDTKIKETPSTRKDFVITGAKPDTYEWDSEEGITAAELSEKLAEREVYLADIKKRQDEYKASKNSAAPAAAAPKNGAFNF